MTKNKANRQSQPQPETTGPLPETIVETVKNMPQETAEVIAMQSRQGRRVNALAAHNAAVSSAVQNKVQLISETETALAKVLELTGTAEQNADTERQVVEAASNASLLIVRGWNDGILSQDEISEMLGRTFGHKQKQNGEPSKTPFGQGEVIRKRVVRTIKAIDYAIRGNEPVAFFDPLPRDDVKAMVTEVLNGKRSVWALYNDLAEMKQELSGSRPKPAFNPKAVVALSGALGENIAETVRQFHDTPGLFDAYAGLLRMIETVGEEYAATYPQEVKAA